MHWKQLRPSQKFDQKRNSRMAVDPHSRKQFRKSRNYLNHNISLGYDMIYDLSSVCSIQEIGRIPRSVDCELMEDLVGTCTPGEVITVIGIVKVYTFTFNKITLA